MSLKCGAIVLILFSVCFTQGSTARILCFFVTPSISHVIVHNAVAKAMVERGHNVTVVTTVPLPGSNPGFRHIKLDIPGFDRNFVKQQTQVQTKMEGIKFRIILVQVLKAMLDISDSALREPEMKKLMNEEFDLVILGYFLTDFHLGLAAHFKCPVVVSWMIHPIGFVNEMVGNPPEIFYVPDAFFAENQPLSFLGRVKNVLFHIFDYGLLFVHKYVMISYYNGHFPPDKYPSLDEVKKNISLVLVNHHFTQGPIRPNVPAMIEIGGIQIKDKPDPLPKDIQTVLDDSSKHGAIYFSFGSNIYSSELNADVLRNIYKVLAGLKQTVLWKWESDIPYGNSTNIIYRKWFPQDDILAHPNLKLFITHGGKGSIVESEFHGVPMIAIPIIADQLGNANQMEAAGFGITLQLETITENSLRETILEVLNKPKYRESVRKFSKLYRDRPQTAKETAIFWLEYVMRHGGAYHMQSPYVHMNIFQRNGLDVIGFLMLVVFLVFKVIALIFRFIYRKIKCSKSTSKERKRD